VGAAGAGRHGEEGVGMSVRVLIFAGSARKGSFNRMLARAAAEAVSAAGGEATLLELGEHPLPLYDGDLEAAEGVPPEAVELHGLFSRHDAFLLASPEYNGFMTPLLKNALDWISRLPDADPSRPCLSGKPAGIMAASPGPGGGIRVLPMLRLYLANLGVTVLARQVSLRHAQKAFDENGILTDEKTRERVAVLAAQLLRTPEQGGHHGS